MHVNVEFLGTEPIENVITSMNYLIDKTIFFGYKDVVAREKKRINHFLTKYCGVKKVEYIEVSQTNMDSVVASIRKKVKMEMEAGNRVYFDITGGESLILVAFGIISGELKAPMHLYDVEKDQLVEYQNESDVMLSTCAPKRKTKMTLEHYVEMHGGVINTKLHKSTKNEHMLELKEKSNKLWAIARKYPETWNYFSDFVRMHFVPNRELMARKATREINASIGRRGSKLNSVATLNQILEELSMVGLLKDLHHDEQEYSFRYAAEDIKIMIWDGGTALELHTYFMEKTSADECKVGVHIDWDGEVHTIPGVDVLNEIDVLKLQGNRPTFISCKSGKLEASNILHALYELQTVAERFGGKYAQKKLVVIQDIKGVYEERAREMGIVIERCSL